MIGGEGQGGAAGVLRLCFVFLYIFFGNFCLFYIDTDVLEEATIGGGRSII